MATVVTLGELNLNDVATYGTISVDAPDPQAGATTRIITLTLSAGGISHNQMVANVRAIRGEIAKATQAYNAARYQAFVSLGLRLAHASETVSFTVRRGWVDDLTGAFDLVTNRYGTAERPVVVTLECEALGVGQPIVDAPSAVIGGANGWTLHRASVPGDEPAYAVMTLTDTSLGSSVLNRIHIGQQARAGLEPGAFAGWVNLAALGSATLVSGEADAIGGDFATRVLGSYQWADLASATGPAPLSANSGLFHVYARVRDRTSVGRPVRNLRVESRSSSGALPADSYMVVVAAWSGTSRATLAHVSEPVYFTVSGTLNRIHLAWDAPIGYAPSDYSIYWKRAGGETWQYKNTGSSNETYIFANEGSSTVEDPPHRPIPEPARFRLRYGLASGSVMHSGPEAEAQLSGNQWEVIRLGTLQLPPQTAHEGGAAQPWRLEVQAMNPNAGSRTVDVDALCLIPAEQASVLAEYEGLNLATKRAWLIASDRAGGRTGLLLDTGSGTEAGHLSLRGSLRVGPGDVELVFIPLRASGVSDVANSRFTVGLTVIPAYRSVTGEA